LADRKVNEQLARCTMAALRACRQLLPSCLPYLNVHIALRRIIARTSTNQKELTSMKAFRWQWLLMLVPMVLIGCKAGPVDKPAGSGTEQQTASAKPAADAGEEAKIQAALAELSPADRKLAEEQGYCAVQNDSRLGSMGKPVKIMVKDQPVFLCCGHCRKTAQADPDKTLARVKQLREKEAPPPAK
jgi:hypothetical protein